MKTRRSGGLRNRLRLRLRRFTAEMAMLLAGVGQQSHESGSLDCLRHGVLADGRAAALAPTDDLSLPVRKLLEQFHILVIDVHRMGPLAIDENRILLLRTNLRLRTPLAHLVDLKSPYHVESLIWPLSIDLVLYRPGRPTKTLPARDKQLSVPETRNDTSHDNGRANQFSVESGTIASPSPHA